MQTLTEDSFEKILSFMDEEPAIDLARVGFVDPYGMVGLLQAGEVLKGQGVRKILRLPESEEVMKYLDRMDFLSLARQYFSLEPAVPEFADRYLRSASSDVLLEITPIEKSEDIHGIVGKVKKRAHTVLTRHLRYEEKAVDGFIVALSEVCQNVVDHSGTKGYVGIQKYHFQGIGRNVVKIAVMDTGVGFRRSLSRRFPVKADLYAIELALFHGASRHREGGRGQGLAGVKRFVAQWSGKLTIRSGSARLSIIPEWSWGKAKERHLRPFPGSQISIMLPEKGNLP